MPWLRYVAVGDSFTEGLEDPAPDGRHRGWADRLAEDLARRSDEFRYANLAVRGRKLHEIVHDQIPNALKMQPDLVSLAGGVNDALRLQWDLPHLARDLETGVVAVRETGADLVIVTFGQPSRRSRALGTVEARLADYHDVIVDLASRYGCMVADFWSETLFDDPRFWAPDRLHLNALGHERVAAAVLEAMDLPAPDWRAPLPRAPRRPRWVQAREDAAWVGQHLGPWVGRRLAGRSSGDGMTAKRATLTPMRVPSGLHDGEPA